MSQDIEIIVIDARGVEEVGRGVGLLRNVSEIPFLLKKMSVYHL